MGRSSRILSLVCLFAATPALAQGFHARGLPMRGPGLVRPVIVRPPVVRPAVRPTLPVARPGRFYPGRGFAGRRGGRRFANVFGFDGVGLGLSLAGDLAVPPAGYGGPAPDAAPATIQPPRCIHPLIIEVGKGMRVKPPRTRVIYGQAPTCVP